MMISYKYLYNLGCATKPSETGKKKKFSTLKKASLSTKMHGLDFERTFDARSPSTYCFLFFFFSNQ